MEITLYVLVFSALGENGTGCFFSAGHVMEQDVAGVNG